MADTEATQPGRQPVHIVTTITFTPGAIERLEHEYGERVDAATLVRFVGEEAKESPSVRFGGTGAIVTAATTSDVPAFAELRRLLDHIGRVLSNEGASRQLALEEAEHTLAAVLAKLGA